MEIPPSVQIALIYISLQQPILNRFACPELATYTCDNHKDKPSTIVGIELAGLVHINYCMYWILPHSWIHTLNDLCGITDLLYTHVIFI